MFINPTLEAGILPGQEGKTVSEETCTSVLQVFMFRNSQCCCCQEVVGCVRACLVEHSMFIKLQASCCIFARKDTQISCTLIGYILPGTMEVEWSLE